MSYYRIRYSATVYTRGVVTEDEQELEDIIESSVEDVLYQIFGGDVYNTSCEVEERVEE